MNKLDSYSLIYNEIFNEKEEYNELCSNFRKFEDIQTLDEAKSLCKELFDLKQEIITFVIGNAKCVVINKVNSFRISLDTVDSFVCYDFCD